MKLFLFDLDGTLVTTGGAGLRALSRAFEELYDIRDIFSTVNPSGKTDPAIFREIIRAFLDRDMADEERPKIAERYLAHLADEVRTAKGLRSLRGVNAFLEHLSQRDDVLVGLGTGNLEPGARIKLTPTQLNPYFSFGGFGSDSEERSEVLKHGHKRGELRCGRPILPQSVYTIGDTLLDIQAARRSGFNAVAVASGARTYAELRSGSPDYLLKDMAEAFDFLKLIDHE